MITPLLRGELGIIGQFFHLGELLDIKIICYWHLLILIIIKLTQKDYENCLRVMWAEISRTYANKPIFIPLLGSGITRFDGTPHKSNFDLLRCMLCTLRTSGVNINQTITILLTEEAMQSINIYEIKGVK